MKYSLEEFNDIREGNHLPMGGELPFEKIVLEDELIIFNSLPRNIQNDVVEYGLNDTVVRENILEYLVEKYFNFTWEEYSKSEVRQNYLKNNIKIKLDLSKLTNNKRNDSNTSF